MTPSYPSTFAMEMLFTTCKRKENLPLSAFKKAVNVYKGLLNAFDVAEHFYTSAKHLTSKNNETTTM